MTSLNKKHITIVLITALVALVIYAIYQRIKINKMKDSSYYPVSYATYPRMTGNDVADTIIERQYEKGHPIMMT